MLQIEVFFFFFQIEVFKRKSERKAHLFKEMVLVHGKNLLILLWLLHDLPFMQLQKISRRVRGWGTRSIPVADSR